MSSLSFSTAQGKTFSSFLSINIPGDGNLSVRSLEDHRVTVIPCDFVCTSSGNEVCGCEGWEKHVLACKLKELCLATCSYLSQLFAANNSVSSEFWCGPRESVIFAAEKPKRAAWRGRGGETERLAFLDPTMKELGLDSSGCHWRIRRDQPFCLLTISLGARGKF